jgi:signal transduction histidine kinase
MTPMPGRRTAVAAILVALAVVPPAIGWYLAGSREVVRQSASLRDLARESVEDSATEAANRLSGRLSRLLDRESERPFYHYRNLTHDPRGAGSGWAVMRSPLAAGAADPLVWAHFEVTPDGEVHLPAVNEKFPELSSDAGFDDLCTLLDELRTGLVVGRGPSEAGGDLRDLPEGLPTVSDSGGDRVLELDAAAWDQIQQAEALYAGIQSEAAVSGRVVIRTGPMRWHTIVLASGPALAALRRVTTPVGAIAQGFVIAPEAISEWLGSDPEGPRFLTDRGMSGSVVTAPVGDTGWVIAADPGPALAEAGARATEMIATFHRTAVGGGLAIVILAAIAILMVAQTDRLAHQRARFAAAAAHELKTPLASVRLHAEMLVDGDELPERAQVWARRIATESERLGRLVTNMLDLSRLERGAPLTTPAPHALRPVVTSCLERLESALTGAGLTLEVDIDEPLPEVLLDPDAVCQILDNLLENAERHTRDRTLRVARVAARSTGDGVDVVVTDTGDGVPRSIARHLFDPFRRADSSGTGGLGLGLAISRALARSMGGDLVLEDRGEGTGATFVLSLRRAEAGTPGQ